MGLNSTPATCSRRPQGQAFDRDPQCDAERGLPLATGANPSPALMTLVLLFAFGAPTLAAAQSGSYFDRSSAAGVLDRDRPDYEALGVNVGSFQLSPSLTVTPEYDDNIYATTNDRVSDLVTSIQPAITVRSDWSRDEVDAFANLASNVYATHSTEDTTDFQLGASGRLDILAQSNAAASVSYGQYTEPRTAEDSISSATTPQSPSAPVQFDLLNLNMSALQTLNRLQFSENFGFQRSTYNNTVEFVGATLPLTYLNGETYTLTGRADYALDPQVALFLSMQVNDRPYDEKPPQVSLDRSSSGYQPAIGADFDITRLVRGQVQVGYLVQNYNSTTFHQVSGPAAHASVDYYLSGMTTLTFNLDRSVIDAVDPYAISFLQTKTSLQIDHELLRNVILSANVAYEDDSFKGVQRTDSRSSATFSANYLLNRHLSLTAEYSFLDENSTGAARIESYVVNVLSLALVFRL